MHRRGRPGVVAAVFLLSIPLCSNVYTLLLALLHYVTPHLLPNTSILMLMVALLGLVTLLHNSLTKVYVDSGRTVPVSRVKAFHYIIAPVYYIGSVIVFFLSFRFIL